MFSQTSIMPGHATVPERDLDPGFGESRLPTSRTGLSTRSSPICSPIKEPVLWYCRDPNHANFRPVTTACRPLASDVQPRSDDAGRAAPPLRRLSSEFDQ